MNDINQTSGVEIIPEKLKLPKSTGALVFGILSIVTCWCFGLSGILTGIIAIALGSKAVATYHRAPEYYSDSSYRNARAGRTCAIIGLILSILTLMFLAVVIATSFDIYEALFEEVLDETESFF